MNHKVIVMKASDEDNDDNIHFTNLTGNHSDTHVILQRSIYHKYGWRARDVPTPSYVFGNNYMEYPHTIQKPMIL